MRFGGGLDANSYLTPQAQKRALNCLKRFGERLHNVPATNLRAVGTNTFRKAKNIRQFLPEAENSLGHTIEVITGREEARLIYESVCYGLSSDNAENQLVVDIGGGSTEIIAGIGHSPHLVESLYIGCVSLSKAYFPNGRISQERMNRAEQAAQLEIRAVHKQYLDHGWEKTLGCSGTIRAIGTANEILNGESGVISRDGLKKIRKEILKRKHTSDLLELGFDVDRCEVLPGGFAVVSALFELLEIESIEVSDLALREGVMYDLLGRLRNEDARESTVQSLTKQWSVDRAHAQRVQATALNLFDQVKNNWFKGFPETRNLLSWAALVHEIGLTIAHAKYHEHGAYLLENSDMAGFSRSEQTALGALVRWHRRKFSKTALRAYNSQLPKRIMCRLCVLLRLAVLLHRPRTDRPGLSVVIKVKKKSIHITFPPDWLNQHPLTRADLIQEKLCLQEAGFQLFVST
ncbi:MAG: Ppx/GppA family phosphatase [Gammaproteobacteria bacterium]|nr:Ppx/GppA family phosphatase [Gammaproteobacteria bacterium]